MPDDEIAGRILADDETSQRPLLSAIELSSGWSMPEIDKARATYQSRRERAADWALTKRRFTQTFTSYAKIWRECGR
jgi:hypothetical protein